MKLLFINTFDPFQEKHGGAVVSRAELSALRDVFDVDVLFGAPVRLRKRQINYPRLLLDLLAGRSLKYASYNILRRPVGFYKNYDLIWCCHDFSAYDHRLFQELGIPFVVRKHNAEHRFLDGRHGIWRYERSRILAFERIIGKAAHATIHISSTECAADDYSHNKAHLSPLLEGEFTPLRVSAIYAFSDRPIDLLCVSNFDWAPNREGIEWFIRWVLPLLPDQVTVHLVGVGSERYGVSGRVVGHGFVPELTSYYKSSKIFFSPVLSGAGIKIKTVSALAAGLPVVSTSAGIDGIQSPVDGGAALVSDNAEHFAAYIRHLLREESICREMSQCGFQWAQENIISPIAWVHKVKEIVEAIKR